MSRRPSESVEFQAVKLGRGRRADPVVIGVAVLAVALAVAVIKPWGSGEPAATALASPAVQGPASSQPEPSSAPTAPPPPTWARFVQVVSPHEEWGIRTIVNGPNPEKDAEIWVPVDIARRPVDPSAIVDPRGASVVAMGITFPRTEAPLAVRVWLDHGDGDLEWIDARPVNEVPGRGEFLFLRGRDTRTTVLPWAPGRYRVDVLRGGEILRFGVDILDPSGVLPAPGPLVRVIPSAVPIAASQLEGWSAGPFVASSGAVVWLASSSGPALDEAEAWLDIDQGTPDLPVRSFVARTYRPGATELGVVLPDAYAIRSADLVRLAPSGPQIGVVGETTIVSGEATSFVAFATPGGAIWQPGVYALRVEWADGDGEHDLTWHVELRTSPVVAEHLLLSATRAWARLAGSSGVLLGWTEPIDGAAETSPAGLQDMAPGSGTLYGMLGRSNAMGCGDGVIPGGATVAGFVGPVSADLTPITSTMLFPLADGGPLPILTAAGAVPGLAVVAPVLTAEFGGPAAYGFRAGSGPNAPGYTICVGMAAPTP